MSLFDNITEWIDDTWEKTCEIAKALPELGTIVHEETRNLGINITDAICDHTGNYVKPRPGSVVICKLLGGLCEHSGIYVGNNEIVELNGDGKVVKLSTYEFLRGSGIRSGFSTYVACDCSGNVLASAAVAFRALQQLNTDGDYSLLRNNCHHFTAACLLENPFFNDVTLFTALEDVIRTKYGKSTVDWKRI